ncbi:hypothetical protein QFC20_004793 [Naganishia adeliensis]|uniref:Uncharacterized protein n=1 Tax=Naganishia adeliensis TaxID=92952 RepID=A0ACC2VXJ0_9TREE|nr:hypothetical protein QFC20_004793 [Naganishia adeliensis]
MDHIPQHRPFHGSVDANEFAEAETYELLEVDHEGGREPEAQGLLSEDVEAKPSLEEGEPPDVGRGEIDEFSMDEMVARTVPSTDDPTLPSLTFRAIVLGSIFCVLGAAASQVFYFTTTYLLFAIRIQRPILFNILRTPHNLPLGKPDGYIHPSDAYMWGRSQSWTIVSTNGLCPRPSGPNVYPVTSSIKEHVLIGIIASSGGTSAYASDIVIILRLYYHKTMGAMSSIVLLIVTQCTGFGLAGMLQDILIKPTAMHWPATLVTVQLFTTLHDDRSKMTQKRLHIFVVVGTFLPSVFFPTLTSIATLCYINNNSWLLRTLGSGYNGLGMFNFSLDWSTIGSNGPLYTPWWAQLNYFAGLMGMVWVVVPVLLATNFWNARDFPAPTSAGLYNSTYEHFDVMGVLNADLSLNEDSWEKAKPLLLTPYFAISYGLNFAALSAVITHVIIWHRSDILQAIRKRHLHEDIHNKLMQAYESVPTSWYLGTLALNLLAGKYLRIAGIIYPGRPIANVTFKCMGYMAMAQAVNLLADQKLGHYTQTLGSIIGCFVNYAVLDQVISAKRPFLDGSQIDPTGQRYPNTRFDFKKINFAIICDGATTVPQSPANVIATSFGVAYAANVFLVKRYPEFFKNFIYVVRYVFGLLHIILSELTMGETSSALDAATSLNALAAYAFFNVLFTGLSPPGSSSIDSEHCMAGS